MSVGHEVPTAHPPLRIATSWRLIYSALTGSILPSTHEIDRLGIQSSEGISNEIAGIKAGTISHGVSSSLLETKASYPMLLMIDNYDSFTYNLVQYLGELGEQVEVYRNDQITLNEIATLQPERIMLSPGPCTPNEAGVSLAVIDAFAGKIPIFGVCLGHQSIGQAFGGHIVRAGEVMHGKTSAVHHNGQGVFAGLPNPFTVVRYHSLVIEKATAPECLEITAWTQTPAGELEEIMGVRHKTLAVEGVQFHPESILTEHGHALLHNFLNPTH